jgi:hypothetical protein
MEAINTVLPTVKYRIKTITTLGVAWYASDQTKVLINIRVGKLSPRSETYLVVTQDGYLQLITLGAQRNPRPQVQEEVHLQVLRFFELSRNDGLFQESSIVKGEPHLPSSSRREGTEMSSGGTRSFFHT